MFEQLSLLLSVHAAGKHASDAVAAVGDVTVVTPTTAAVAAGSERI
jgi:hypothetical protein